MRIYKTPEIEIEEISTSDIVLASGSTTQGPPSSGDSGTVITPRGGITSVVNEETTNGVSYTNDLDVIGNF